jgi:hypothetical protein
MKTNFILCFLSILFISKEVFAHPSPHSLIQLDIQESHVLATIHLPLSELEVALKKPMSLSPLSSIQQMQPEILNYIGQHIDLINSDGALWKKEVLTEVEFQDASTTSPDLVAKVKFYSNETVPKKFSLRSNLIEEQVPSHKIFVTLHSDWENGVFATESQILNVLHFLHNQTEIQRGQGNDWTGFAGIFNLGLKHIAEGSDHLIFLLMLLLPAPLIARRAKWRAFGGAKFGIVAILKIVTAFTFGHSLTLALGAMDLIKLPERLTESLIALSVLISAIHALKPVFPKREWQIAFAFGLVHGLAFSAIVLEFGLSHFRFILSLLGFNLGIEAMQILLLVLTLPWILMAATSKHYLILRNILGILGISISASWLFERAFDLKPGRISSIVDYAQSYPFTLYALIVSSCLLIYLLKYRKSNLTLIKAESFKPKELLCIDR